MKANATITEQIKPDRTTKTILVTGATGDTGRPTVKLLLERGYKVKALVRKEDERARILRDQGADVVVGNLLDIGSVRKATDGISSAYLFILSTPSYREKAQYFQNVIGRHRGLDVAAGVIEQVFQRALTNGPLA